jgi:hypothetical protein
MAVVSIAAQLLMPKPKRQANQSKSPDLPSIEAGVALPIVWGRAKVGGAFFYSTPPKRILETKSVGKGASQKQENEYYRVDVVAYAFSHTNPVKIRKLFINGELVYDPKATDAGTIEKSNLWQSRYTFYPGTLTQDFSPEIAAIEGSGNVPNFRGMSYIVFNDFNLTDFGNQFPQITALLESTESFPTVADFLNDVIEKSGVNLDSQTYFGANTLNVVGPNLSAIFRGTAMMFDGKNYLEQIQPLVEFYQLIIKDDFGVNKITTPFNLTASNVDTISINLSEYASVSGEDLFSLSNVGILEAPNQLSVNYSNIGADLEPDNVLERLSNIVESNATDISLPYALNRQEAATGAARVLRNFHSRKKVLSLRLPVVSFGQITQGTLISISDQPLLESEIWVVNSLTIGDNGFMDLKLSPLNTMSYYYSAGVSNYLISNPSSNSNNSSNIIAKVLDSVSISTTTNRINPYLAVSLTSNTSYGVYTSTDGIAYTFKGNYTQQTSIGSITAFSVDLDTNKLYAQEDAWIEVDLENNKTFSSVSEADWYLGTNVISINGSGLVQFRDAQFLGGSLWRLTGLIFNAFDTELITTPVNVGDDVVLVKASNFSLDRLDLLPSSTFNGTLYTKILPSGVTSLLTVDPIITAYSRNIGKALAPLLRQPSWNQISNAQTFRWSIRSIDRSNYLLTDGVPVFGNPDGSLYEITYGVNPLQVVSTSDNFDTQTRATLPEAIVYQNSGQVNTLGNGFVSNTSYN